MGLQQTDVTTSGPPEPVTASRGQQAVALSSQDVVDLGPEASTWRARRAHWRAVFCQVVCSPSTWQQRILCALFWILVLAVKITIFVVVLPRFLAKPMQDLITLLALKLTRAQIIAIVIAAIALLPCTLVLPMVPFIWIAGIALDFGTAFGIVMVGSFVGMSMQYWMARCLFKEKVEKHLLKRHKDGMTIALRAVEICGPWKLVALVRLGPHPYAAMNYMFGVCPTIKYHQYIIASVLCTAHRRALAVFFGRSMPTLAELFSGKPVRDVGAAVYRLVVLVLGIALVILIVILAKKALKKIQDMELERERQEAEVAAAAEAAAAAEEGAAGLEEPTCKPRDSVDAGKQQPLPEAIEGKLAGTAVAAGAGIAAVAAAAAPGWCARSSASSSSDDDLQIVVVDDDIITNDDSLTRSSRVTTSSNSSYSSSSSSSSSSDVESGSAEVQAAEAPAAGTEAEAGAARTGSWWLPGVLSSRVQRPS